MVRRIAERVEHHHRVGHRRDRSPPSPSSPFSRSVTKATALVDRARAGCAARKRRLDAARSTRSSALKNAAPGRAVGPADPVAHLLGRRAEQFGDADRRAGCAPAAAAPSAPAAARSPCATSTTPCGVEGEPARQEHDLDRHHRHRAPRHLAEQRQLRAGEDVGALRAAGGQDRLRGRVPCAARRDRRRSPSARNTPSRWPRCRRRRRGTAASRHARPGSRADRRRSSPPAPGRCGRGYAPAARIRPGWWRRPPARTPSARPACCRRSSASRPRAIAASSAVGGGGSGARVSLGMCSVLRWRAATCGGGSAGPDRTFDRGGQAGGGPVAGQHQIGERRCAGRAAAAPAPAVAAKVARRSFTTRQGGIGAGRSGAAAHIGPDCARRSPRRAVDERLAALMVTETCVGA